MKLSKLHKGSVVKIVEDDVTIEDFINSTLKSPMFEDKNDSYLICDVGKVMQKWKKFQELLPQVQPFYAVKCNPDHGMLQVLADLGANFDCSSKGEIKIISDMGITPDRIIYSNPCKQASHIRYAKSAGVNMLTFDNELELHKIKQHYPDADLVLRIKVNDSQTSMEIGGRYDAYSPEVVHLLQVAWKLELKVIGVSFHIGFGCNDSSAFYETVKDAKHVFDLGREVGYSFSLLDVGDGFPGRDNEKISFEEAAQSLSRGLAEFFPPENGVRIVAEPARYLVASAVTAVCNIISVREVAATEDGVPGGFMYYLNDGVYGSFNCIFYDHYNPKPYPLKESDDSTLYNCSVWGPTCDCLDCITSSAQLPKMSLGDWICFDNMGAYSIACQTQFNAFNRSNVLYICHRSMMDESDIAEPCMPCKEWANIPAPLVYPVAAVY